MLVLNIALIVFEIIIKLKFEGSHLDFYIVCLDI